MNYPVGESCDRLLIFKTIVVFASARIMQAVHILFDLS
jgi:hypothetical protein